MGKDLRTQHVVSVFSLPISISRATRYLPRMLRLSATLTHARARLSAHDSPPLADTVPPESAIKIGHTARARRVHMIPPVAMFVGIFNTYRASTVADKVYHFNARYDKTLATTGVQEWSLYGAG